MKAQKLRCPQTDINNSKCPQKALQGNVTLFPVINFSITLKFCEPFFRRKEISVHDYSAGMSHFGWSIVPVSDGNLTSFNRRNVSQTQAFEKFSEWGSTTQASLFWLFSFSITLPNLKVHKLLLKMLLAMVCLENVKQG